MFIKILVIYFQIIRYKKGERDGKGKEYNKDENSVFEGEYQYGRRIKGKYYVNGKLIFEGEYSGETKHGKGKEYNNKGKLIFNGEYQFGEKINKKNKKCFII